MKIQQLPLNKGQFFESIVQKRQITLHNTGSNYSAMNVISWWNKDPKIVATPYIIAGNPINKPAWDISEDGAIFQCFDDKFWAGHIGQTSRPRANLNQQSIGIEICNWDWLIKQQNGLVTNAQGVAIPQNEVIEIAPFKGKQFFEVYTDSQLESLRLLIDMLCKKYNIPKKFNGKTKGITAQDFELSPLALRAERGIFAHSNYRLDKWDINPQPKMLYLLNNL